MCSIAKRIIIERGTRDNYASLSKFHYLGRPCAVFTRIWRARDMAMNAIIGVLVETMPCLNCRLRDMATNECYQIKNATEHARLINRDFRSISRVIVHPAYRGAGISVMLVRCALEQAHTHYVEAIALMGNVHPFFEQAGMRRWQAADLDAAGRMRPVYFLWENLEERSHGEDNDTKERRSPQAQEGCCRRHHCSGRPASEAAAE